MLAYRLKQLRISKGLNQEDVADALHISKQAVCRYENGSREPSLSMLTVIADFYDVDFNYLLNYPSKQYLQEGDILLLRKYHSLDDRGRSSVLNVLEHEYANIEK